MHLFIYLITFLFFIYFLLCLIIKRNNKNHSWNFSRKKQHFTHSEFLHVSRHNPLTASNVGAAPHQMARCAPPAGRNQQGAGAGLGLSADETLQLPPRLVSLGPQTIRFFFFFFKRQQVFFFSPPLVSILLRARRTSEEKQQTVKRVQSTECLGLPGSRRSVS